MSEVQRILQNTPGTVSQQWYESGDPVDPGTVTIGITAADGTEIEPPGTAASVGVATGPRSFPLTTAHTALLDRLTITWTSTLKGTLVSYVEIVGAFLFSLQEARAFTGGSLSSETKYPDAAIVAMRNTVEQALEDELDYALVPRYAYERINGDGMLEVALRPYTRAIRSLTIDGETITVTPGTVDVFNTARADSLLYYSGGFYPRTTITVGYEHGQDGQDQAAKQAGLLLAKAWLVSGPVDDRVTSMSTDAGTAIFSVPGRGGSIWGIPDVDSFVKRRTLRVGIG